MQDILKQYTPVIFISIVFSLLLAIVFSPSWGTKANGDPAELTFLQYATQGSMAQMDAAEVYDDDANKQALGTRAVRTNPIIEVNGHKVEDTSFILVDNFTITDCDGLLYSNSDLPLWTGIDPATGSEIAVSGGAVRVIGIHKGWLDTGADCIDVVYPDPTTGVATFADAGVYTVTFTVMDRFNVETTGSYQLAIDMKV